MQAFMSASDELDKGTDVCAQFDEDTGRCILPNDGYYNRCELQHQHIVMDPV
jgi:hypothetical protein